MEAFHYDLKKLAIRVKFKLAISIWLTFSNILINAFLLSADTTGRKTAVVQCCCQGFNILPPDGYNSSQFSYFQLFFKAYLQKN